MAVGRAVVLCDQILDALEHAHASGIVHRDLKPGNVMVTTSGDVKVMDFGIARVAGSAHLTMDGYMMGTPAYMAPEQVRGEEVDRRMDLYSAAVVLYRLLTGRLPFEADSAISLIHSQLSDPPTPPRQFRPDLPDWIETILMRGLAKGPADRFQTAAEFRLALERGLAGTLTQMVRPGALGDTVETIGPTPTPTALRRVSSLATAASPSAPVQVPPTPTGTSRTEATLTLRTPQLALAGGLLALLVIGVGFLAYAALRRPVVLNTPVSVTAPADAGQPPTTVAGGPVTAPTSPPVSSAPTSQPPAGAVSATEPPAGAANVASPAAPAASGPTSFGWRVPAVTSLVDDAPSNTTAPPASASAAPGSPGTGAASGTKANQKAATPQAAGTTGARSNAPAPIVANPLPVPAAAPAPAPETPVIPAFTPQSYGDIKTLVADGDKTKEIDVLLGLEHDKVVVRNRDNGSVLRSTAYQSIAAATYAHTKSPRWQDGENMAPVPKNFGGSGFFLKSSKHWLTLQSKSDFLILRLEDKNVRAVLSSIETRTGAKVKRVDSD